MTLETRPVLPRQVARPAATQAVERRRWPQFQLDREQIVDGALVVALVVALLSMGVLFVSKPSRDPVLGTVVAVQQDPDQLHPRRQLTYPYDVSIDVTPGVATITLVDGDGHLFRDVVPNTAARYVLPGDRLRLSGWYEHPAGDPVGASPDSW